MEIFIKIWEKTFDSFSETFFSNRGKNKDEDEKNWENESNFWFLYIKIRLYGNFYENLCKKYFYPFFRIFLTNWDKNEDEDEKLWENETDFLIIRIKIRLCDNFHENPRKNFDRFLKTFLTIWGKNENEEKNLTFYKNLRKKVFFRNFYQRRTS